MGHWENFLTCEAALGAPGDVRRLRVYSQDAMGLAVTAHVSRLSLQTGPGRGFFVGRKWVERMAANAVTIQEEIDNL